MATVRHLGFLKIQIFNCMYSSENIHIIIQNFVTIAETVAEIQLFRVFTARAMLALQALY